MENFDLRIARLERRLKTYQYSFVVITAIACFFISTAFVNQDPVPELLRSKKIEIIDNNGNVLVTLGAYEGKGTVTTYSETGLILTDIIPSREGAGGIVMYDNKGNKNLELSNVTGGGGFVNIKNPSGTNILTLGRTTANDGCLMLYNSAGKNIVEITGDVNGDGVVITQSHNGEGTARVPQ
jgi:hypothetical protein